MSGTKNDICQLASGVFVRSCLWDIATPGEDTVQESKDIFAGSSQLKKGLFECDSMVLV